MADEEFEFPETIPSLPEVPEELKKKPSTSSGIDEELERAEAGDDEDGAD